MRCPASLSFKKMVSVRSVYHQFRAQIRPRYLVFTVLLTLGILGLEFWLQEPYEVGRYMAHKRVTHLLPEIRQAHDARIPHSVPVVPKLVHFTWGAKPYMRFHTMLSMLSAYHFIKPDKIIIWYCITKPSGKWWDYLIANVTNNFLKESDIFELRYREDPTEIFGRAVRIAEHKSDIVRLDAVRRMGGIYLDTDVLVLRSFDSLLLHDCTMGLEEDKGAQCNGVIIGRPDAVFFKLWWDEYRTFNDAEWGQHSVKLPALLSEMYPRLCYVLPKAFHRPNWHELEYIFGPKPYDWKSQNYAMHLWFRLYNVEHDLESIKKLDSTYGEMCRYIIYGQSEMM